MKITGKKGCIIRGQDRNGETFDAPEALATRLIARGYATEVLERVETATREAPETAARRTTRTTTRRRRRG